MRKFVKFIDSLPFAGKMTMRPALFDVYQSRTRRKRLFAYLWLLVVLGLFIPAHGIQAIEGWQVVTISMSFPVKLVGLVYALVNVSVVLTQVYWGIRATGFLFRGKYPAIKRKCPNWKFKEIFWMVLVTLGGQIIFGVLYVTLFI